MDIGVGLPTTLPVGGADLVEWARRAEHSGFATLGVLDRLVYDNYEPLVALAAAAAVTRRIRLATTILIAAYRGNTALLAKQLASLDRLSGGRLTVGVAAGGREDDFAASGQPYRNRGRRLDRMIGELRDIWSAGEIGPRPADGRPEILVGGHSPAAMDRAAAYADGWIAGGSSASAYPDLLGRARQAWAARGRTAEPRVVALAYVALGPGTAERAVAYLTAYYAFIGPKAEMAARSVLTDAGQLRDHIEAYDKAGCHELVLFPCVPDLDQLGLIARAVA